MLLPERPHLATINPSGRPVMDEVDGVAYCRRCGTRLGVVCPALVGVVPPPEPHTSRSDCETATTPAGQPL